MAGASHRFAGACKRILVNKQIWFLVIRVKAVYNNYRVKGMKLSRS